MNLLLKIKYFFEINYFQNRKVENLLLNEKYKDVYSMMLKGYVLPNHFIGKYILKIGFIEDTMPILQEILLKQDSSYKNFFDIYAQSHIKKLFGGYWDINTAPKFSIGGCHHIDDNNNILINEDLFLSEMFLVSRFLIKNAQNKISLSQKELFCFFSNNKKNIEHLEKIKKENENIDPDFIEHVIQNVKMIESSLNELMKKFQTKNGLIQKENQKDLEFNIRANKIDIDQLPHEILQDILDIQNLYIKIKDSTISDLDFFNIDKMFRERQFEVVEHYLSIPVNHRDTTKNREGKTAKDLLLFSIREIKEIFSTTLNKSNIESVEDNLAELNIKANYIRNVKKNI